MRVRSLVSSVSSFVVVLLALVAGCSKSSSPGDVDAGPDSGSDSGRVQVCGDGFVDVDEECDDENDVETDVCANDCTFAPICGDGTTEGVEECDDGDNLSGDGCSGDCHDEVCGNARLDPGEVCDGTPGCASDCLSVPTCGDGDIDAGEQCDDGNDDSWDGCSSACERERAVVVSDLDLVRSGAFFYAPQCDQTGDGRGDSSLGLALALAWPLVGSFVTDALAASPFQTLVLQGLADPTLATDDPNVRIAWVLGDDANGGGDDFDGTGEVRVDPDSLSGGLPSISFAGSIAGGVLNAGPEDVLLPFLGGIELGLRRSRVVATPLRVAGTAPDTTISVGDLEGLLCGSVQLGPFANLQVNPSSFGVGGVPSQSCDPDLVPADRISLADLVAGGVLLQNSLEVVIATQPDVDMDGDGLESYVVVSGESCQAVIVGCLDGDGTSIPGRGCVTDVRMADTITAAFRFTAPTTTLVP